MNNTVDKRKEFYQAAMYNGTLLGAVWSVMYLLLFIGTDNIISMMLCMALFVSSPFIAANLAIKHRRKEWNNTMGYLQAWIFVFYMYVCATLLSALVSYIYLTFIDGGAMFMTLQKILDESLKLAGTDALLAQQIEQTKNIIEQTTTGDFVWQLMSRNFFDATIMPLIIALFVKRKRSEQESK